MNQNKIGEFIVNLRKNNNLTQAELADKLGVTYQAVSKWENGKSIPDILLLKKIGNEFHVSVDELLSGKKELSNNKNYVLIFLLLIIILIIVLSVLLIANLNGHYEFKEINTNNKDFAINGIVAYSKEKSSIYISNIQYNEKDDNAYRVLECRLYHQKNNVKTEISQCGTLNDDNNKLTTLNNLLENISFKVDDYSKYCHDYKTKNLYLEINATNKDNKIITYNIPLKLDGCND